MDGLWPSCSHYKLFSRNLSCIEVQRDALLCFCSCLYYLRCNCSDIAAPKYGIDVDAFVGCDFGYITVSIDCCVVNNLQTRGSFAGIGTFVGHSHSIDERPWAQSFIHARKLACPDSEPDSNLMRIPLFYDGSFGPGMVSSCDITQWLRIYLQSRSVPFAQCSRVSSHACKAGCVSLCAPAGVPEQYTHVLCYHKGASSKSVKSYSRDDFITPLRCLADDYHSIHACGFLPDETRSGMFVSER